MHLLFATSLVTSGPPESGYEIANAALLAGLRRQGAVITELGYKWPGTKLANPDHTVCLGDADVKTDGASAPQKLAWLAKAVASGLTFTSAKLRIADESALAMAVTEAKARHGPIDGVVLNAVALAGAYETALTQRPYVFVAHNVEHVSASQNAEGAAGLIEKLMYRREARFLKALENRLCAGARHVLTLSEEDGSGFGVASDEQSTTVALVTPEAMQSSPVSSAKAFDVGLIGSWTWTPNRIGLEWFFRDVVPLLPGDFKIAVAGSAPRGLSARDGRVMMLGRVLDAKAFCTQSHVMALTSRIGTGVQLKTIEAFEMGLPCVATQSSMRGISHTPENVLVADTAEAFADALTGQVHAARFGQLPAVDGATFRANQLASMDAALAKALSYLEAGASD